MSKTNLPNYLFLTVLSMVLYLLPLANHAEGRHIAILIDTSSSMRSNDKARYTVQLTQIIAELLDPNDKLTVIGMLDNGSCSVGPSMSLALHLNPNDYPSFKQQLDTKIQYDTGTYFAAAIRTAIQVLSLNQHKQRMLLIIADSGGLDCRESWDDLVKLHDSGAMVAAMNIGSSAGAFDSKPGFDFTAAALDSEKLVAAVAQVYQKFLGAKQVQTGAVQQNIEVEIAPFVSEAFLVVAADGSVNSLQQVAGNPNAKQVALNHGSGQTTGLDGRTRHYRIARLAAPASGSWRFKVPNLTDTAGWMLIQDSTVSVRFISPPVLAKGIITPIEIELYDKTTGLRITELSKLTGLNLLLNIEGQEIHFNDDGIESDHKANDGVLTGQVTFNKIGKQQVSAHLQSDFLDRKIPLKIKVIKAAWHLEVTSPSKAEIESPATLSVALHPIGRFADLIPPQHIEAITGDLPVILRDNGKNGDQQANDKVYSGVWKPFNLGKRQLEYIPIGGTGAKPVNAEIEVIGNLKFGKPVPINLGQVGSNATTTGVFDLSTAEVKGTFEVQVSTDYVGSGTTLEIDAGNGWVDLETHQVTIQLNQSDNLIWPLRLRTGRCPAGSPANETFKLIVEGVNAEGKTLSSEIMLSVEILEEPWLTCWWLVIATGIGGLLMIFVIYGFISPARFPSHLGVVLSPEENMDEGFFHPIRAQRGTGSGFYRDAKVHICADFRLSGKSRSAIARLRAEGKPRIQPVAGNTIWQQTADGAWEKLPREETMARFGTVYKDDLGVLFFQISNG
jgi:hypothetical protein